MVKPEHSEHLRVEREAKTVFQYNKMITMDKMKGRKRNESELALKPVSRLDSVFSSDPAIVKLQSGLLLCFQGRPGFWKQVFAHRTTNRSVFNGYSLKSTASCGSALSLACKDKIRT